MLTLFSTPKAFIGHSRTIQRNALQSWKLLHPSVEVILFGDEEGAASACHELGLRHEPDVQRCQSRLPYVHYLFSRAQAIAQHDYLCYSNCDMIFFDDFLKAFETARAWREKFLMIGRRWDTDVMKPVDFDRPDWAKGLRNLAVTTGFLQDPGYMDYFVFPKGLYDGVPPLLIGRSYWDQWAVWKALSERAGVLDCSSFAMAVHQNHDYGYHPDGKRGADRDDLSLRNKVLSGNGRHQRSILDATHRLTSDGDIRRNVLLPMLRSLPFGRVNFGRALQQLREQYQQLIERTFLFRNRIGLRRETLRRLFGHERESPR
jgi:hypothetical protein